MVIYFIGRNLGKSVKEQRDSEKRNRKKEERRPAYWSGEHRSR